tara:strand:- start:2612 stop:2734 length:123 start_codon:yes stop_codon:yes gene_type:complete
MAKKPIKDGAVKAAPSPKKDIRKGYVRSFGPNVKLGKGVK